MESNKQKIKRLRNDFRESVFKRDGFKCVFCDIKDNLDAHHIKDRNEMINGGYTPFNGISLCKEHHLKAEMFHMTNGEEWEPGFHPDDLFKKINSSYIKAVQESIKLK